MSLASTWNPNKKNPLSIIKMSHILTNYQKHKLNQILSTLKDALTLTHKLKLCFLVPHTRQMLQYQTINLAFYVPHTYQMLQHQTLVVPLPISNESTHKHNHFYT